MPKTSIYYKYRDVFAAFLIPFFIVNIDLLLGYEAHQIKDRANYYLFADKIFAWWEDAGHINWRNFFLEEPLFVVINLTLRYLGAGPDLTLRIIMYFSVWTACFIIIKRAKIHPLFVLLIFTFPWLLVNYFMTLRQGLATAFMLFGYYYSSSKSKKYALTFTAGLIHYSYFVVISIFIIDEIFKWLRVDRYLYLTLASISSVILFFVIILAASQLGFLGESSGYQQKIGLNVGFGFIFWFLILFLFSLQGRLFFQNNSVVMLSLIFYIVSTIFFPPMSRILQNFMVLILVAGGSLTGQSKIIFWTLIFLHSLYFVLISIASGGLQEFTVL